MEMKLSSVNVQPSQIKFVHVSKPPQRSVWHLYTKHISYKFKPSDRRRHTHMLRRKLELGKLRAEQMRGGGGREENRC